MPNGIPTKVREQADEARRKAEQYAPQDIPPGEGNESVTPPQEPTQQPQPEGEGNQTPQPPQEGIQTQQPPAKAPEQYTAEETEQALSKPLPPQAQEGTDEAKWEHRYKVLKGKYDAEVGRLHKQVRELEDRVQELRAGQAQPTGQSGQNQDGAQGEDILAKARAEYSEDEPLVKALEQERSARAQLEQQLKQMQGQQRETAEERFWNELNQAVPDWELINQRAEWHHWLAQADPVAGETRQTILDRHHSNLNGQNVANLFNAFLNEYPQVAAELRQTANPQPSPQQQPNQPPLESQVEPSRTATDTTGVGSDNPPVYPLSDYQKFMTDYAKGRWEKMPRKRDWWYQEYQKALQEERIDPTK